MTGWTRRQLGAGLALATTLPFRAARAQAKPHVVVIGGGIGGASVAKALAAGATLDVTLVEPNARYATCCFSNLYLAGLWSFDSLTRGYETLQQRYGISLVREAAAVIDPDAKSVRLASGRSLPYDRLVVSPGIAFRYGAIDGLDEAASEAMPHAWIAGVQSKLLRAQLEAMEDGGVFVIAVPPAPYRCPTAPYERACLAAYYFRQFKPRAKVIILDAGDDFVQREVFQDAWARHYPGMIDWLSANDTGGVTGIDLEAHRVRTARGSFQADVANIIPRQAAGVIAQAAGLADASGWCPIDPATFESRLRPGIHVIGDAAAAGAMPKTAFCANSQAKLCANAILTALTGAGPSPPHLLDARYTFLAGNDAIGDASFFTPADGTIALGGTFFAKVDEKPESRRKTARAAMGWYDAFTQDVFE